MSRARRADPELDGLIAEITVDCYDEEEALMGFANAFDDIHLPCRGSIVGEEVEVLSIGLSDGRRELVATCERAGRRHEVALLDADLDADPETARLIAAYRRWLQ
jgi:hypothetical protein